MRQLFFLLLLLLTIQASGQGYIVLKDGQRIKYKKFKTRDNDLVVDVVDQKTKQQFNLATVLGYYTIEGQLFYWTKPELIDVASNYQLIKREMTGKINLYMKTVNWHYYSPNGSGGSTSYDYYYIEKSNRFETAFVNGHIWQNKKEKIQILKDLVSDHPQVLAQIDDEFKLTVDHLKKVVREYNLAMFTQVIPKDTSRYNYLIVYARPQKPTADSIPLSINGDLFSLGINEFLKLKIYTDMYTKICVGKDYEWCDLIEGSTYVKTYLEVDVDKKLGYSLKPVSKDEAEFYIKQSIAIKKWK